MEKTAKIYVAGHHGLVGSAIWNNLQQKGYTNLEVYLNSLVEDITRKQI